jgi:cytochrome b6-f complex iron-sulfur subunit
MRGSYNLCDQPARDESRYPPGMNESRRFFLQVLAVSPLAGTALGCGAPSPADPAAFGDISAGNISDVPVGTLRRIDGQPAVIARDAQGLYAMTVTCTHQGCDVRTSGSGDAATLACPCHGSRFDRNGSVIQGPAESPLAHFAVELDSSGNITIHGGTRVEAAVRVAVQ